MLAIRPSRAALGLLAGFVLALAAVTPAAAEPLSAFVKQEVIKVKGKNGKKGQKLFFRSISGKAHTDGTLTPGGIETLNLQHLPKKAPLLVGSGPSPLAGYCGKRCRISELVVSPVPIYTTVHGKAFLSFTMPTGYYRDQEPTKSGKKRRPTFVPYRDGDIVLFSAFTFSFGVHKITFGEASAEAVIDIP